MAETSEIIELIVKISPELLSLLKDVIRSNQDIEEKLTAENLGKKLDDLIVREIQSAFLIIEGVNNINSEKMKERHLDEAERCLLKNISLDPTLVTAGKNNSHWSAQAYYGLSLIASFRKEELDASRFVLHSFVLCPSEARNRFAKPLYLNAFEPHCQDIFQSYESEIKRLPEYLAKANEIKWKLAKERMKWAGYFAMGAAGFFMLSGPARNTSMMASSQTVKAVGQQIGRLERELSLVPTEESLKKDLEAKLDTKCRELATNLLSREELQG
jgi:hypothetical protein